jgi:hypothetical protein
MGIQAGDTLQFTKPQEEIMDEFDSYIQRTITSFNDFLPRPEFVKVKVVSQARYEEELEEEQRMKKLNI